MQRASDLGARGAANLARAWLLALALALPALTARAGEPPAKAPAADADDDDDDSDKDDDAPKGPSIYLDLSATMMRAPANTLVIGRRGFLSFTGSPTKSLSVDLPLTIDITENLSVYAGIDFGNAKSGTEPWSRLALGNLNAGFSYTFLEQTGFIPELSVSGSVSRPLHVKLGLPMTTAWSGGLDADFAFDEDRTRGLLAGLAFNYLAVNSRIGQVEPLYGGYVGAYRQWENGWKLTGKAGYSWFGGGHVGSIIRATPVRQVLGQLELEKYDGSDNKLFGIALGGSISRPARGKTSTTIQLVLSAPLYLVRQP
jgi:hypothetical protein